MQEGGLGGSFVGRRGVTIVLMRVLLLTRPVGGGTRDGSVGERGVVK